MIDFTIYEIKGFQKAVVNASDDLNSDFVRAKDHYGYMAVKVDDDMKQTSENIKSANYDIDLASGAIMSNKNIIEKAERDLLSLSIKLSELESRLSALVPPIPPTPPSSNDPDARAAYQAAMNNYYMKLEIYKQKKAALEAQIRDTKKKIEKNKKIKEDASNKTSRLEAMRAGIESSISEYKKHLEDLNLAKSQLDESFNAVKTSYEESQSMLRNINDKADSALSAAIEVCSEIEKTGVDNAKKYRVVFEKDGEELFALAQKLEKCLENIENAIEVVEYKKCAYSASLSDQISGKTVEYFGLIKDNIEEIRDVLKNYGISYKNAGLILQNKYLDCRV